jgi:hypothetical protein
MQEGQAHPVKVMLAARVSVHQAPLIMAMAAAAAVQARLEILMVLVKAETV